MGRVRRELIEGVPYHVTVRINNRLFYFDNTEAKRMFIEVMKKVQLIYKCKIECFTIMNNHVHLIVKPRNAKDLPGIMHRLLMTFAKRFNKRFKQSGHVWESRYYSRPLRTLVDIESTFRYIAKNPVTANLVKSPIDWFWSSIAFYERKRSLFISDISIEMRRIYEKYHICGYQFD